MGLSTIITLCLTALLSVVRTVLECVAVDAVTGFYTGFKWLVYTQNTLYVLSAAAVAALVLCGTRKLTLVVSRRKLLLSIPLTLAGAALTVSGTLDTVNNLARFTGGDAALSLGLLAATALSIAAGLVLVYLGVMLLLSAEYRAGLWLCAVPAMWMAAEAVARFMAYPTIASISDQTLEIVALCAGALFWLMHARCVARQEVSGSPRQAVATGYLFALFAVSLSIGQLAAFLTANGADVHMTLGRQLSMLFMGLYACVWSSSFERF